MTRIHKGRALILRTCNADMTSHGGFVWPRSGPVEAPDWKPTDKCGSGLHGFLWGEGNGNLADWSEDAVWLVAEVAEWIDLRGKVKFPRAEVLFAGSRHDATRYLHDKGGAGRSIIGGTATAGDGGIATAGDGGTATAGIRGIATAGIRGIATAGDFGIATAGYSGTATAGDGGTATAGIRGIATAGDGGTATAGDDGIATAGDFGIATAGYSGTATAGDWGTATAGDWGIIQIKYYDGRRYRIAVGYVGENGIEPNVPYRCVDGKLVRADGEMAND